MLTKSQIYGTEIRAKPAEKLVIPMALVRNVGGYWNEVNAGIIAFATPVVLLPENIKNELILTNDQIKQT